MTTENSAGDIGAAFKAVFAASRPEPVEVVTTTVAPGPAQAEQAGTPAPADSQASEAQPSDELTALRAERDAAIAEREETRKKASESISWARSLTLRKSTEADQARQLLTQAQKTGELDKESLERFLATGTLPAQSANPYGQPAPDERMMLDASQFVFDYGLSEKQAESFTTWLGSAASTMTDRDFVAGDHYSTLRHGYERYRQATTKPDPVIAQAAASVARTQREVARAAANPPSKVMPADKPTPQDPMKMTADERLKSGMVDQWFKELNAEWTSR